MKIIEGDLIALAKCGKFDLIIHGCNCFCSMGAGIAKSIKSEFPEAYRADLNTKKGDKQKLGSYSFAEVSINGNKLIIINAYTQFEYGGNKINVSYASIEQIFKKIKNQFSGKRIAYPAIGAGLARGNWEKIYDIICEQLNNEDHTFVQYKRISL